MDDFSPKFERKGTMFIFLNFIESGVSDLYVEALSPIVMVFEDVAFGRSSGLEVMSMGPWSYGISAFVRRDTEATRVLSP